MRSFFPGSFSFVILLLVLNCCAKKDPVSLLINELEEGAEERNIDVFQERLASSFVGNESVGREEAVTMLRRYFAAYERLSVEVSHFEHFPKGNRLKFRASFFGQPKAAFGLRNLLPSTDVYDFELRLIKESETLKVYRAYWQQVSSF